MSLEYQKKFSMSPKVIAVTSTATACSKDLELFYHNFNISVKLNYSNNNMKKNFKTQQ
jgi:hypothetical protein